MKRLTSDRAVRRYLQIRAIEETVKKLELSIEGVQKEIDDADERLKELRKQKSELLKSMREAANDEGQLPLFGVLSEELIDLGFPAALLPTHVPPTGEDALL
jgi:dsDNA-specific endonuclease/ATPase MutS2